MSAPQLTHERPDGLPSRIGPYQVVGRLAQGGMAELLLGRRFGPQGFARSVAIKRILPHLVENEAFVTMFLDEARLAAAIQHPNVVTVEDLSHDRDGLYMVMEYLAGESLSSVIRRLVATNKTIDPQLAVHIMAQACAGLHAAHSLKGPDGKELEVVHRDVSPHNLFITYDGSVKVLDFGIAQAANRITKTESGSIKGKFGYMSPEQVSSEALDRRTDVFALGIVFYELITLRRLFKRDNPGATLKAVLSHPIAAPSKVRPELPRVLDPICLKALERDLDERYASCADFRRDLLAVHMQSGGLPEEQLRDLMTELFGDRAAAKSEMLQRMHEGQSVSIVSDDAFAEDSAVPRVPSRSVVVSKAKRTRSRRLIAGAAAAVLMAAAFALGITRPWESEVEATPSATVRVGIRSMPSGATVTGPNGQTTTTPGSLELPRSDQPVSIVIELDGYQTHTESVMADIEQRLRVQLRPVEVVEVAPPEQTETPEPGMVEAGMVEASMESRPSMRPRPSPTTMEDDPFRIWD